MTDSIEKNYVYYNIDTYNNSETVQSSSTQQNRSAPILENMSDYKLAISRFQINTTSIPIMNYENDFFITLSYREVDANNNVIIHDYSSQLEYLAESVRTIDGQPIYHYTTILRMVNIAFEQAWNNLNNDFNNVADEAPRMLLNQSSSKFSIVYPIKGYDIGNIDHNEIRVYMNYNLFKLFDNFVYVSEYNGVNFNLDKKDIRLLVLRTGDNVIDMAVVPTNYFGSIFDKDIFTSNNYLMMSQTFPTLNYWSSFNKVIISSNSVSTRTEWITNKDSNGGQVTFSILQDFEFDYKSNDSSRNIYTYNSSLYRWMDILGHGALYSVDISIYYQDARTGKLFLMNLSPAEHYSMKLLFRTK